jgi:Arc/MetJ-type ribon-helix-helix transcriptional regulator
MAQKQKYTQSEGLQAAARFSKSDYTKIQNLIDAGMYRSFADFLREAVRDKLGSMEVISVKAVKADEAERMIENYLKTHPGSIFASELADVLGLDFDITFKTIKKLLEEGRIKKAKQ